MPRPFTAVEKDTIREQLLETGRACFLRYGLKKTTIEDLTGPSGIAKASFYLFFESKEALYLEIFIREIPSMMKRLMDKSFGSTSDTREALALMMKAIANEMETNEFSRVILDDPSELRKFATSMNYHYVAEQVAETYKPIVEAIVDAQRRGEMIPGDPLELSYSLGLIKMLVINRAHLPPQLYESMMELTPRIVAAGLTSPSLGATAYRDKGRDLQQGDRRHSAPSSQSSGGRKQ